jgi:hypothetical protein
MNDKQIPLGRYEANVLAALIVMACANNEIIGWLAVVWALGYKALELLELYEVKNGKV